MNQRAAAILCIAALALIGLTTLTPSSTYEATPTFCIFCGTLGGVDFTLNVVLFMPLGLAVQRLTGRWTTAVVVGALTTVLVEALQWRFIPGRDASLGDLVANTLGTMLGAWLAAAGGKVLRTSPAHTRALAGALGVATSFVITLSAALLRPIDPIGAQYVQWTPERPNMDVFRGNLVAVQLNGRLLRPGEPFPSQWTYDSLTRAMAVRALVRTPVPPSQRQAIIVRIGNEEYEGFMLGQRGDGVVFRSTMGAARLKLRSILVEFENALVTAAPDERVLILRGTSNPKVISVGREQRAGVDASTLRRTVGLAWAMLLPWDLSLNSRWWPANAVWLAVLVFPVTFLTMRSRRARTVEASARFDEWPLGLVLVALIAPPALMGLSFLGPGEWLGVASGVATGVLLERGASISLSKEMNSDAVPTLHP